MITYIIESYQEFYLKRLLLAQTFCTGLHTNISRNCFKQDGHQEPQWKVNSLESSCEKIFFTFKQFPSVDEM